MSPANIADHALALAAVVASQDEAAETLLEHIARFERSLAIRDDALAAMQQVLAQADALHSDGRKRDARNLIKRAASADFKAEPAPPFDRGTFVRADEAWPDIFTPEAAG